MSESTLRQRRVGVFLAVVVAVIAFGAVIWMLMRDFDEAVITPTTTEAIEPAERTPVRRNETAVSRPTDPEMPSPDDEAATPTTQSAEPPDFVLDLTPKPGKYKITGIVEDGRLLPIGWEDVAAFAAEDGVPIGDPLASASTNEEGRFTIALHKAQPVVLIGASREAAKAHRPWARAHTVKESEETSDIGTIRVAEDHFVSGTIARRNGPGKEGRIEARLVREGETKNFGVGAAELTWIGNGPEINYAWQDIDPAAEGRFTIAGLAPRKYEIAVHTSNGIFGNVHNDMSGAAKKTVVPTVTGLDFSFDGCTFLLDIRDAETKETIGQTLCYITGKGGWGGGPFPAELVECTVEPGMSYVVRVEHPDYEKYEETIVAPRDRDTFLIPVILKRRAPGPTVVLDVIGDGTDSIGRIYAVLSRIEASGETPWSPAGKLFDRSIEAVRSEDDKFRFKDIGCPAGEYRFSIRANSPIEGVMAMFSGPSGFLDAEIRMHLPQSGEIIGRVEFAHGGIVRAVIADSKDGASPKVELRDTADRPVGCNFERDFGFAMDLETGQTTQTNNQSSRPALRAGDYVVVATWSDGRTKRIPVKVKEGETVDVAIAP